MILAKPVPTRNGAGAGRIKNIIKPRALRKGDRAAIVSPASPDKLEKFDAAVKKLTAAGFDVVEGEHSRDKINYFAGSDQDRADDFNRFLASQEVSALIASRGGYGCSRLLPMIDYDAALSGRKIIIGGSDLTALLWSIHQKTGLVTFYGPMAVEIGGGLHPYSENMLWRAVQGELKGEAAFPLEKPPLPILPGTAEGRLIGGCLSLVVNLLGAEYFGDVEGRILFLEEIGEKPFRIDRMLTQLRNAGVFDKIAGLLLGDFKDCWEGEEESFTLEEIISDLVGGKGIPVMGGLPFGHQRVKMTLPLGVKVSIDCSAGKLIFLEEAVIGH